MAALQANLADILTCAICLGLYDDPHMILCGHSFCLNCIRKVEHPRCPKCRKDFDKEQLVPNVDLRQTVDSLREAKPSEPREDGDNDDDKNNEDNDSATTSAPRPVLRLGAKGKEPDISQLSNDQLMLLKVLFPNMPHMWTRQQYEQSSHEIAKILANRPNFGSNFEGDSSSGGRSYDSQHTVDSMGQSDDSVSAPQPRSRRVNVYDTLEPKNSKEDSGASCATSSSSTQGSNIYDGSSVTEGDSCKVSKAAAGSAVHSPGVIVRPRPPTLIPVIKSEPSARDGSGRTAVVLVNKTDVPLVVLGSESDYFESCWYLRYQGKSIGCEESKVVGLIGDCAGMKYGWVFLGRIDARDRYQISIGKKMGADPIGNFGYFTGPEPEGRANWRTSAKREKPVLEPTTASCYSIAVQNFPAVGGGEFKRSLVVTLHREPELRLSGEFRLDFQFLAPPAASGQQQQQQQYRSPVANTPSPQSAAPRTSNQQQQPQPQQAQAQKPKSHDYPAYQPQAPAPKESSFADDLLDATMIGAIAIGAGTFLGALFAAKSSNKDEDKK